MARRERPRSTPRENLLIILSAIPWKLLLLLPILIVIAVPTYLIGTGLGGKVFSSITGALYTISAPSPGAAPTPQPAFPTALPKSGSIVHTVQEGDSCVAVLAYQMRMNTAGQVFSDAKPETVKALNQAMGKDCHRIQPGMELKLWPHYPLAAFGGVVKKISSTIPQQVLPTPLIKLPQREATVDCSRGCLLTVRVTPQVEVKLVVNTLLTIREGSWIWTQAMLERKKVKDFANYPYVEPDASLNGMTLRACDFQVDDTHDDDSNSCSQTKPNTIREDGGAWLLGVVGSAGLDHWRYPIKFPTGTRVLMWLSAKNDGTLAFEKGNPLYRYDEASQLYVKA